MDITQTYTNMAKAIKWQIPFASLSGTLYRIDIYAEGYSGDPIQLTAGESPFVTEEDSSEDFFAPIRTQTGSIQVCTRKPDGTMLTLDEILPANNIDHPVRLINLSNSNAIEWQGFLSCEAYSQNYTSIPENLSLPVISVLEAMDSVEMELNVDRTFKRIINHITYALDEINKKSGIDLFRRIYISKYCNNPIRTTSFYSTVYSEIDEIVSGENIVVDVHSISCKKILEYIATFFGCTWREVGRDVYLEAIGKNDNFKRYYYLDLKNWIIDGTVPSIITTELPCVDSNMNDLESMGVDHKQSILQGAKRVKVTSKLADFECNLGLRESPLDSLEGNPDGRQANWGEVYCNTNETFYSLAEHKHRLGSVTVTLDSSYPSGKLATINLGYNVSSINYQNTWFWANDDYLNNYVGLFQTVSGQVPTGTVSHYLTSFMGYMRIENEDESWNLASGLVLYGFPDSYRYANGAYLGISWPAFSENDYIYKQSTPLSLAASDGKFIFELEFKAFITNLKTQQVWRYKHSGNERGVDIAIKWGSKWLKRSFQFPSFTYEWVDNFTILSIYEHSENTDYGMDGVFKADIPIESWNTGLVTIYVYPKIHGDLAVDGQQNAHGLFVTRLNLS